MKDNKLIAEFMGVKATSSATNTMYYYDGEYPKGLGRELQYNTSWDWLMPVVKKIESIELKNGNSTDYYDVWIMPDCVRIGLQSNEKEPIIIVNKSEGVGSINHEVHLFEDKREATYKAVVEFIEWYNQNKNDE